MLHEVKAVDCSNRPLRVVISGCGAVTRLYAAPALARLAVRGLVEVVAVYDPDPAALGAVLGILPITTATQSFEALLHTKAELVIIAAPPRLHVHQATAALDAGLHVFCEKPLATRLADADHMLAAAASANRLLTTGLVRRHFPATRMVKELLDSGVIGPVESVTWFEGGPFNWPVSSPSYFSRATCGGGVLLDIGTHCLDLLSWWLGPPTLIAYEDDEMGGIEANCLIDLDCAGAKVRVRLSRDWARPNRAMLRGARGTIGWTINDTVTVDLDLTGAGVSGILSTRDASDASPDFIACFAQQLADCAEAVRLGRPPQVPTRAGRDVLALIEACYAARHPMEMSWITNTEHARAASLSMRAR